MDANIPGFLFILLIVSLASCTTSNAVSVARVAEIKHLQANYKYIGETGYRMSHYHGPTPPSVPGAPRITTEELVELIEEKKAVLIDVVAANYRPATQLIPAGWLLAEPRQHIPGSIWLPNVGFGTIDTKFEKYLVTTLRQATAGNLNHPVVFYCRTDCWGSWNAVQRAANYGYAKRYWYDLGPEGWQAAGFGLVDGLPMPLE